jgi:hypothetical protein
MTSGCKHSWFRIKWNLWGCSGCGTTTNHNPRYSP